MIKNSNPFNITKAVDYSDLEIDKFWVDIPGGNGFSDIVKPQQVMPIMILGGKGSGKTHIMRYFSFNLQKIRYGNDLLKFIEKDKYIGVFLRCGGLNSSKFIGESQSSDAWKNIFSYYFELWLSQLVINIIEEILQTNPEISVDERDICKQINNLFDLDVTNEFASFSELKTYLQKLQRGIDYEVNNCAITGEKISSSRILVSPGKLIFGLPKILQNAFEFFKDCQFLYLIDEYENLLDYQQKYINTLIREREDPVSFRIGARWYGIKTYKTFSGNEDLKIESEYEKIIIDQLLRDRQDAYAEFAKQIFMSRLKQAGFIGSLNNDINFRPNNYFREFNLNNFLENLRDKNSIPPYLKKLGSILNTKDANKIIDILSYNENPLIERTSLMLFFRAWKNGQNDFLNNAVSIADDRSAYLSRPKERNSKHFKVLDKFKNDLIDQLHRENLEKLPYMGLDKIIKMSAGIPRLFLITLKHIYRWSIYNGETPFFEKPISEDAQLKGIEDAIKWFLDDARVSGPSGIPIANIIDRVGQLMHLMRFSDAPPECSLSSFTINSSDIDEEIQKTLDYLEQYSYLIKGAVRREKNSSIQRATFQINGLLSPHWELPIFTRGVLQLDTKDVKAIFGCKSDDDFNKIKGNRKSRYYAPFKEVSEKINPNPELF
ncbi:ORC-CDC6 family AAA ATPase [Pedobacter sp.]